MTQNIWRESNIDDLEYYLKENRDVKDYVLVKIFHNDNCICTIEGNTKLKQFKIKIENEDSQEVFQALKYTGSIPLRFTYTQSKTFSTISDKMTTDEGFIEWFNGLINKKRIFPDTNILLNRTFSTLEESLEKQFVNNSFEIPRLLILELEAQGNEKRDNNPSKDVSYLAGLKKRKALIGFSELLYLTSNDAQPLGQLPIDTLTDFNDIAGKGRTDAWTRYEIRERYFQILRARSVPNFIFITADMVNSLAALAEGLDTIYISQIPDWKNKILSTNLKQISRFLINLSILYTELTVSINSKKYNFKGFWNGITTTDIINQQIRVQEF